VRDLLYLVLWENALTVLSRAMLILGTINIT